MGSRIFYRMILRRIASLTSSAPRGTASGSDPVKTALRNSFEAQAQNPRCRPSADTNCVLVKGNVVLSSSGVFERIFLLINLAACLSHRSTLTFNNHIDGTGPALLVKGTWEMRSMHPAKASSKSLSIRRMIPAQVSEIYRNSHLAILHSRPVQ